MRKLKNNELGRINIEEFKNTRKTPITIILDNVRSALNVGSVFRTSDAFLIKKIILCGITATPPNKEIRKAALGSTESIAWEYAKNTIDVITNLKKKGFYIIAIEQTAHANPLEKFNLPDQELAIVLGHEVNGVSQEAVDKCNEVIEIPQFGTKHSLNISVATGIVIWELWKKVNSH